jgi:hypothetical protein
MRPERQERGPRHDDADHLIDRQAEVTALRDIIARRATGLILIIGGPRMGKRTMLREVRRSAINRPIIPPNPPPLPAGAIADSGAAPAAAADEWLTIDSAVTAASLSEAIAGAVAGRGSLADDVSSVDADPTVVLILGYHPTAHFDAWFVNELRSSPSRFGQTAVFIAGYASDLAHLRPIASQVIELNSLPEQSVADFLASLNSDISNKLNDAELSAYGALISRDLSAARALRDLLRLEQEGSR